jgi:oxaloacetate decarboxylase beta subunit
MYLAIEKKYEPLLLLPLSFGILIANIPIAGLSAYDEGGLMNFLYQGIIRVIYPPLIFLCIGSMTDFGPLISSPRSALIGLGGQLGIFVALGMSLLIGYLLSPFIPGFDGFTLKEAASIGIIGSSDGPTSIFTATRLAPELLPSVAIAAFSYMALVPFIQPPIMRALTTAKERVIVMPTPKRITQRQKILFPIAVTLVTLLLVPTAGALIGMLMLGNLIKESGVTERYVRSLQNDVLNILTLLVGLSIGSSATADRFLTPQTLIIIACGLLAFVFGTIGGILVAKLLCKVTNGEVNPLIGNSGVSALPMAARISQRLGQQYNPQNHLLMHAMGPIVSSTIGSAIIAGIFLALFSG